MKKITVILMIFSLISVDSAFAARFGRGRSHGMQRNMSQSQNYNQQSNFQQSANQPINQPQQRPQMGNANAAMLGAAAGAAGGYMLGRSSANNNSQSTSTESISPQTNQQTANLPTSNSPQIPWGMIIILVAILGLGLVFFRKKTAPGFGNNNQMTNNSNNNPNNFNAQSARPNVAQRFSTIINNNNVVQKNTQNNMEKMPDGIETIYFLRQVKGMFLHIQSMNTADNLDEIKKYMVSTLFDSVKDDIANNNSVADFTDLTCRLLECIPESAQPVSTPQADGSILVTVSNKVWDGVEPLIASVKFSGLVSDDPTQAPQPFNETWNFVKSSETNGRWLVCGIQQDPQPDKPQ